MIVSTADAAGRPSSRTVLLKHFDDDGFVFYTNYDSRKGRDLAENPHVSLLFPWHPMARQVIVTGAARRTGRDETAAYFRTRPHGSQLGAWASGQSSVIGGRAELDAAYADLAARYPEHEQVPVPAPLGRFPGGPGGGGVLAGPGEPPPRPPAVRRPGGRGLAGGEAEPVKEREPRAGDEETAPSPAEATVEARALAARGDVTAEDVVGVLRAVREARARV
ncbi:hypothetical protein GCM10023238_40430 [Streptomyces heliomycini]